MKKIIWMTMMGVVLMTHLSHKAEAWPPLRGVQQEGENWNAYQRRVVKEEARADFILGVFSFGV